MSVRQECPGCKAILLVPENGKGRCPRCQTIVQHVPEVKPAPPIDPLIPEISAEHEASPAEVRISVDAPLPPPAPPPMPPSRPRRRDWDEPPPPELDIGTPREKPSKTLPLTLLILGFVAALGVMIGTLIYLVAKARQDRPRRAQAEIRVALGVQTPSTSHVSCAA